MSCSISCAERRASFRISRYFIHVKSASMIWRTSKFQDFRRASAMSGQGIARTQTGNIMTILQRYLFQINAWPNWRRIQAFLIYPYPSRMQFSVHFSSVTHSPTCRGLLAQNWKASRVSWTSFDVFWLQSISSVEALTIIVYSLDRELRSHL